MSVSCLTRRCVKAACVSTTFPATPVTVLADSTTTRICWSASVSLHNSSAGWDRCQLSTLMFLSLCLPLDNNECESEETCSGGQCVNTLGTFYCTCEPPLVLDDTQRSCVNTSSLTEGERCTDTHRLQ